MKNKTVVTGMAALAAVAVLGACSNAPTKEATTSAGSVTPTSTSAPAAAARNQADVIFAHHMVPHHRQAIEMSDMILVKQGIDPQVVELATQIKAAQGPEIATMQGWLSQWGMPEMPMMSDMPGMGGMHGQGPMPGSATPTTTMSMPGGSMMPSGSMPSTMPGMGGMGGMDGMDDMPGMMQGTMSAADMDALKNAQGVEASKLFLTQMITHHQGAITMAQKEIKDGQYPDAVALARSIITRQQQEIDTMNKILKSL